MTSLLKKKKKESVLNYSKSLLNFTTCILMCMWREVHSVLNVYCIYNISRYALRELTKNFTLTMYITLQLDHSNESTPSNNIITKPIFEYARYLGLLCPHYIKY